MFQHVVLFKWSDASTAEQREEAVAALRRFADTVADLAVLQVGADERLREDNFDVAVIARLDDVEAYRRYVADPRHVELIERHLKPILAARAAVQAEFA